MEPNYTESTLKVRPREYWKVLSITGKAADIYAMYRLGGTLDAIPRIPVLGTVWSWGVDLLEVAAKPVHAPVAGLLHSILGGLDKGWEAVKDFEYLHNSTHNDYLVHKIFSLADRVNPGTAEKCVNFLNDYGIYPENLLVGLAMSGLVYYGVKKKLRTVRSPITKRAEPHPVKQQVQQSLEARLS